jgi:O-antigen/teichoic acid export membrane protein
VGSGTQAPGPPEPQARLRRAWKRIAGDLTIRRALRNSGWLLGANGITGVLALAQGALLTRALGVGQFGAYAVVTTFVTVVNRVTSFRMNEFVVKYVSDGLGSGDRDRVAAAVKYAMIIEAGASVLAFLVLAALAPLGAEWFVHDPAAAGPIRLYSLMVLAMLVAESSVGILQVFGRFRLQALLSALGSAALLVATLLAFVLGGRLEAMLGAAVAAGCISWASMTWAALRAVRAACGPGWWRVPLQRLGASRRSALGFALSTNASATLSLVTRDADVLWLSFFRGAAEAGLYRLAFTIASYVVLPVGQLGQAFYPEIAREAARGAWGQFRRLLRRGTAIAAAYVVPVAVVVGLLGAPIIRIVYGAAFAPAAPALAFLLAGMGFANVLFWNRPALLSLGRADYPFKVNLGIAALKIIGVLIVVPAYGYIGNAALLTGLYLVGVTVCVYKVWSEVDRRLSGA